MRPVIPIVPAAGGGLPPPDGRWRMARLLSAPHRLGFFAAALMFTGSGLWWGGVLCAQALGWALPWAAAPSAGHAVWMVWGYMPLFITGFWFTAGPRWLQSPPVPAPQLLGPVLAMLLSWGVAVAGFHVCLRWAGLGLAIGAAGWTWVCALSLRLLARSRTADRFHARWLTLSFMIGALLWWCAAFAAWSGRVDLLRMAAWAAVWWWAAPVFAVASHRMIPFFGAGMPPWVQAWRPNALVAVWVGALWFEGGVSVLALGWSDPPRAAWWAAVAVELPVALLLAWMALRWGLMQNLRLRLLAMLHTGFLWLGVSFLLSAISHARMAWDGPAAGLGLAPLHAMTVGYLATTLVAMVTRVASAHSGHAVAADAVAWRLHGLLQVVALARVGAALWPAHGMGLSLLAVAAWCVLCTGWSWRHGRWLGQPRADGRPDDRAV